MNSKTTINPARAGVTLPRAEAAIWQEVEWGHYTADFPVWEELAAPGAHVLELGCGAGRVALHLADRGRNVIGLDHDPVLVADLSERRPARDAAPRWLAGDASVFEFSERFNAILAPLQLVNILGPDGRRGMLRAAAEHLSRGGVLGISFLSACEVGDLLVGAGDVEYEVLPDVRELDGWVFSSRPLDLELEDQTLRVRRLREVVSPTGERREDVHEDTFVLCEPDVLKAEAASAGLALRALRSVPPTQTDAGSAMAVLELAADSDRGQAVGNV